MLFDFKNPELVLAGTLYGEARGGGASGMADVASVVVNRAAAGWSGGTVCGVCLAPWQFSCWSTTDPNRSTILAAAALGTDPHWLLARQIAAQAIKGAHDHTMGADSYYAVSIKPPLWAHPPATHTVTRWLHSFWRVRPGRPVPVVSAHAGVLTADQLNAAQLAAHATGA